MHERRIARGSRGEPDSPLGWSELIAKFDGLAAIGYGPARRNLVVGLIRSLDELDDVRTLTAQLGAFDP